MRELDAAVAERAQLIDLGCGVKAASLRSAQLRFGVPGIGLELRHRSVERAQAAGLPVYQADACEVRPEDFPAVRFVSIDNVLEHLPSLDAVRHVLAASCALASELVHIRHPSFDSVEHLAELGLKQYWTDWPGEHICPAKVHDLVRIANDVGCYDLIVRPVQRALDSDDPTILPASAPPGQRWRSSRTGAYVGAYDAERHGPKPEVAFDRPVHFAFDIVLVVGRGTAGITYPGDPETSRRRPHLTFTPW